MAQFGRGPSLTKLTKLPSLSSDISTSHFFINYDFNNLAETCLIDRKWIGENNFADEHRKTLTGWKFVIGKNSATTLARLSPAGELLQQNITTFACKTFVTSHPQNTIKQVFYIKPKLSTFFLISVPSPAQCTLYRFILFQSNFCVNEHLARLKMLSGFLWTFARSNIWRGRRLLLETDHLAIYSKHIIY